MADKKKRVKEKIFRYQTVPKKQNIREVFISVSPVLKHQQPDGHCLSSLQLTEVLNNWKNAGSGRSLSLTLTSEQRVA